MSRRPTTHCSAAAALAGASLLLGGCALTTGVLGLGTAPLPEAQTECAARIPLRHWASISGDLLVSPTASGGTSGTPTSGSESRRIRLVNPVAVAASGNRVFIADAVLGAVIAYDRATQTARRFAAIDDLDPDASLSLDRALSLYVANPSTGTVSEFDIDGRPVSTFGQPFELSAPVAAVVDDGRNEILIADRLSARILVFNRRGGLVRAIGAQPDSDTAFQSIAAMALEVDQLYVVDPLARRVHALGADGTYRYAFGEELNVPGAIAADAYNRVFVADTGDATIKVFQGGQWLDVSGISADRAGLGFLQITALWESDDLLYVADAGRGSVEILRILPPCP